MLTRLVHIVIDAADPARQAAFWSRALGWEIPYAEESETAVWPAGYSYPEPWAPLVFVSVPEPADVGQGNVPWTVLADPEGSEFCVLTPR